MSAYQESRFLLKFQTFILTGIWRDPETLNKMTLKASERTVMKYTQYLMASACKRTSFPEEVDLLGIFLLFLLIRASQVELVVQNLSATAVDIRDSVSSPGWGRSPGEGHVNPLQYSCLETPHGQRSLLLLSRFSHVRLCATT